MIDHKVYTPFERFKSLNGYSLILNKILKINTSLGRPVDGNALQYVLWNWVNTGQHHPLHKKKNFTVTWSRSVTWSQ